MVACKGAVIVWYEKRWTLEEHMDDLDKKLVALANMTEHHLEEASKSRARERHVMTQYAVMLEDIMDDLWWEIGELRATLDERDSTFYLKDQKQRNKAWSEWVDKNLEMGRLEKRHRELIECLNTL